MNEIVAACQFESELYIFTRNGDVYKMYKDHVTGDVRFSRFHALFPEPRQ